MPDHARPRGPDPAWIAVAVLVIVGCAQDPVPTNADDMTLVGRADQSALSPGPDLSSSTDLMQPLNACGDHAPTCAEVELEPPFALHTDPMADPLVADSGLERDINGALVLDPATQIALPFLWIPNQTDLFNAGSISRYSTHQIREVARYRSVTCNSLDTGGVGRCDGTNGCCAGDDWKRFQARQAKMPQPPRQPVQTANNYPSRTAMAPNGDLFVANQAFGGQSSVTRIAANLADCVDRNKNGRIDTSSDTNGNGTIETDCNGDGAPDDIANVQGKPCSNLLPQEFYGLDDECVLWTTNTFTVNQIGRSLASVPRQDGGVDVWAGSFSSRELVSLAADTGRMAEYSLLPADCRSPASLLADGKGILWSGPLGAGTLCYLDAANPRLVGTARTPAWGPAQGLGLAIDRDQNIWVGSQVARYTPDRSNGFANLGNGWWTKFGNVSGIGIAADARNANAYFVYSCTGAEVIQIPASAIPVMKLDRQVADNGWPRIQMGGCFGVGVDTDQNVWAVPSNMVTRARVDQQGGITQPSVNGQPMGNNVCPAGDSCKAVAGETISDFTGFNAARWPGQLVGHYYRVLANPNGCKAGNRITHWFRLQWDADVPAGTTLTVGYRPGVGPFPDPAWNKTWTTAGDSPAALDVEGDSLEVELLFASNMEGATPALKSLRALSECR